MRRSLISLTILIATLLSACSGSDASETPAPITLPTTTSSSTSTTTTTIDAYASLAEVRMEPYCSSLDGFCMNFPVVDEELLNVPQTDPHDYTNILAYGYDNGVFSICKIAGFTECMGEFRGDELPMMNYNVSFSDEVFPGEPQSEWYTFCNGKAGPPRENIVVAGQPAVRVSCSYGTLGTYQGVYFRHKGREVQITASSQLHAPLFFDEMVASFQLTA